jgi:membrane-associated protease RseP (regulator of RpoE activity)
MAKRAGMLVTEFFIGFGPRIFSFRRGETEYGLKVIPAGAYVKIIGMSNLEEVDPALESRTYRQKSFSQRVGVAVAGSTMHFLLAFLLLFVQFAFIGGPDGDRWQVAQVTTGSAADAAGLREGDELLTLDGVQLGDFDDFRDRLADIDAGTVDLTVRRDGAELTLPIDLSTRTKVIGTVGEDVDVLDTGQAIIIGGAREGGVAAAAGLVGGTTLLAVDGTPVQSLEDVRRAVARTEDGTFVFRTVTEAGVESDHTVDLGSAVDTTAPSAFVGVGQRQLLETESVPAAAWSAVETFGSTAKASVVGVGRFFWPPNIIEFVSSTVSGADPADPTDTPTPAESTPLGAEANRPISIIGVAMLGSDLSAENLSNLVQFLAMLNIFLGIFNLVPLLPFDGGHVVIACYEKLQEMRRRTGQRYLSDVSRMAPVAYAVLAVLVVVGGLAIFLDLTDPISL